jgi:glycosyltransferase involved in cell wall biosynthesis
MSLLLESIYEGGSLKPAVSVVIASYNQQSTIKGCLQSVLNQNTRIPYEVIVVDSSTNDAAIIAKSFVPRIKLISRKQRTSWGAARNIGIKRSKGEIIAFTDTDCLVSGNWIEEICKAHKNYSVVGGPVRNGNPGNLIGWMLFLMEFGEFAVSKTMMMKNLPGCNVSYKKSVFTEYGILPANQWSGLGDDFIFNARIKEEILYSKNVNVAHINKTNMAGILRHAFEQGKADARAIRGTPELPGRIFVKRKFLIPFLIFYRLIAIGCRAFHSKNFGVFLLVSPLVALNIFSWNAGFLKGAVDRV